MKCIFSESTWYSPIDFEALGGKAKSRYWRRSILYENKPFSVLLSSLGVLPDKSSSPSPPDTAALNVIQSSQAPLTNPVLAFVKAYRLRGDTSGLHSTLHPTVDASILVVAYKALWQHCKTDLETLGLFFKNRRDSDKRSVSDAILDDITASFDALVEANKLPPIFVEATDLSIPPIVLDPIAKKLSENT